VNWALVAVVGLSGPVWMVTVGAVESGGSIVQA
jgi:hypothetical protein